MEKHSYHRTIAVSASPEETLKKISQVNLWWKKSFNGKAEKVNDEFVIPFGKAGESFVNFKITEHVPGKKVVWSVTDCYLPWFTDKKEWNNTRVVFELSTDNQSTKLDFTHEGLVPGIECYEACEKGWDGHVTMSLLNFINSGTGNPD